MSEGHWRQLFELSITSTDAILNFYKASSFTCHIATNTSLHYESQHHVHSASRSNHIAQSCSALTCPHSCHSLDVQSRDCIMHSTCKRASQVWHWKETPAFQNHAHRYLCIAARADNQPHRASAQSVSKAKPARIFLLFQRPCTMCTALLPLCIKSPKSIDTSMQYQCS